MNNKMYTIVYGETMTIIYTIGGDNHTLEEIVDYNNETRQIWNSIIIDELNYWTSLCLDDLIINASTEFQDELYKIGYDILFVKNNDDKFDYNKLLDNLRR